MSLFKDDFKGLDIPNNKEATKDKAVEIAAVPKKLYFPMSMHIGAPAKVEVKEGDSVKIGTLLGSSDGEISTNIHSSVSGTVTKIEESSSFRGESKTVIIENNNKEEIEYLPERKIEELTPDILSNIIDKAGITGKGGAGFPASVKYNMKQEETRFLVINGSECEPYSTTDYRCMIEFNEEIIQIIRTIVEVYTIEKAYIAIEDHMTEAIACLEKVIKSQEAEHIYIHKLSSEYPQGHAGLQIQKVLGIEIEEGQRSGDVGILQSNVSTIKAIYDAVYKRESLVKRIITVTGPMIHNPKNLMVRIGTRVEELIEECGGLKEGETEMINGGPMMGRSFTDTSIPVDKDTTTLLFLEKKEQKSEKSCIRCARCVDNCPVALQPIIIRNSYINGRYDRVPELRSESCISCGVCTYICPADIELLESIQALNKKWKDMKNDE